ncbi:hypothetical protein EZS27_029236 [termite gut metagenome]|uniref:Uncharacterized protein n=1 Tax=termite gut metagenome TaxID=433724 RepID=A0A5J4QJ87_9ZZZZ
MEAKKQSPAGQQGQSEEQRKDSHFRTQYQIVYESFLSSPKTMFACEIETGIPRPYICWYVRGMRKRGEIQVIKKGRCPISKWDKVGFYTTNPALFIKQNNEQLNLFEDVNES